MSSAQTRAQPQSNQDCFWERPLRQPIFGKRDKVLVHVGHDFLILPDTCCRCGSKAKETFPFKVEVISKREAILSAAHTLAGGHGHVLFAIHELTREKVQIPCCSACRLIHRFGFAAGAAVVILSIVPFLVILTRDQDASLRAPVWRDAALFGATLLLIGIGTAISYWATRNAVPVIVYRMTRDSLYFEVWSLRYQKLALNSAIQKSTTQRSA